MECKLNLAPSKRHDIFLIKQQNSSNLCVDESAVISEAAEEMDAFAVEALSRSDSAVDIDREATIRGDYVDGEDVC